MRRSASGTLGLSIAGTNIFLLRDTSINTIVLLIVA